MGVVLTSCVCSYSLQKIVSIYNSLILSNINYAILAWGYQFDRIYKIKKL